MQKLWAIAQPQFLFSAFACAMSLVDS